MTVKVTLEYDELPEELGALEQHHNAGQPAQEVGYQPAAPASVVTPPPLSADQVQAQERHPEDFQFHNAGRPAVVTGGGNELSVKAEWDPDPGKH